MLAQKWDYRKHAYDPYVLPEGASIYETNMDKIVSCASCGKKMLFGQGLTSMEIHTKVGWGYCVCEKRYAEEVKRRLDDDRSRRDQSKQSDQ